MKETYGVPVEEILEGIKHGVRKVNIDTDIRLAMTAAIRKFLHEKPQRKFDPRDFLKPATRGGEGNLQGALRAVRLRRHGRRRSSRCRSRHIAAQIQDGRARADRQLSVN